MKSDSAVILHWRIIQSHEQDMLSVLTELKNRRIIMWTKPAATEMRFGFEVTMYVMNK